MPVGTLLAIFVVLLAPAFVPVQSRPQPAPAQSRPQASTATKPAFKPEELEQVVAPVALHPDSLLSQVLMASTYPLEVVEAARWVKANQNLKGEALTAALEKKQWDPSVKSLVNFPQVLAMMDEKLDWTQKLGDAVLAQQKEVMEAVQRLRKKAKDSGNLESSKEQKVTVEQPAQTIVIQSADPQVIYVPTYNPTVVYGGWPYPAYPPYYYYPPGYVAGGAAFSFMAGVAVGAAWGYAWGGCHWGHSEVDIDINRNTNINNNIDRSKYKNQGAARAGTSDRSWQHDPSHRKGASYRDQSTAQRYQKGTKDAGSREQFRGFADQGRQDLARDTKGGASQRPAGENRAGASNRPEAANRAGAAKPAASKQGGASKQKQGAFDSQGRGSEVKSHSTRGQTSRQGSSSPTVRSSGGGSRGGGGGGGRSGGGGRR